MSTFGEMLRRLRKERGLSLDSLAKLLGTTKQVLSRYETNQRTPKITTAKEYADILNVPLSYFFVTSGDEPFQIRTSMETLTEDKQNLIFDILELSYEQMQTLSVFVQSLKKIERNR